VARAAQRCAAQRNDRRAALCLRRDRLGEFTETRGGTQNSAYRPGSYRKDLRVRQLLRPGYFAIDLQHAPHSRVPGKLARLFNTARLQLLAHALVEQDAMQRL